MARKKRVYKMLCNEGGKSVEGKEKVGNGREEGGREGRNALVLDETS